MIQQEENKIKGQRPQWPLLQKQQLASMEGRSWKHFSKKKKHEKANCLEITGHLPGWGSPGCDCRGQSNRGGCGRCFNSNRGRGGGRESTHAISTQADAKVSKTGIA